jgi:hypothetical protein
VVARSPVVGPGSPVVELVETREADSVADVNNLNHRALVLRGVALPSQVLLDRLAHEL